MSLPTNEQWRAVPGYEGFYEVSDHGRVRSIDRWTLRIGGLAGGRPMRRRGKMLRPRVQRSGHVTVCLYRDRRARNFGIHQLVLVAFVGPCPDGMEGCHGDGNPANNHWTNLRWDTSSANSYDRVRHGRDRCKRRTHCPRGHALAAPNLVGYNERRGHRNCLACSRARTAARKAARNGQSYDLQAESDAKYQDIMGSEAAA